mmetsp:Transcript_23515/g.48921  ORF Transcript_23515/g.48921 Transcript_23515/m.48921 type:complete len:269 (-) Transcript_23515:309-1115(-)
MLWHTSLSSGLLCLPGQLRACSIRTRTLLACSLSMSETLAASDPPCAPPLASLSLLWLSSSSSSSLASLSSLKRAMPPSRVRLTGRRWAWLSSPSLSCASSAGWYWMALAWELMSTRGIWDTPQEPQGFRQRDHHGFEVVVEGYVFVQREHVYSTGLGVCSVGPSYLFFFILFFFLSLMIRPLIGAPSMLTVSLPIMYLTPSPPRRMSLSTQLEISVREADGFTGGRSEAGGWKFRGSAGLRVECGDCWLGGEGEFEMGLDWGGPPPT